MLASTVINIVVFILAATFLKGALGCQANWAGCNQVGLAGWWVGWNATGMCPSNCSLSTCSPLHGPSPSAGPRAKPVISEEALQELDANREDSPAQLPPSLIKASAEDAGGLPWGCRRWGVATLRDAVQHCGASAAAPPACACRVCSLFGWPCRCALQDIEAGAKRSASTQALNELARRCAAQQTGRCKMCLRASECINTPAQGNLACAAR